MQIILNNVGKRYNHDWIFRHCSYMFNSEKKYAVTGSNGSGKSTLLQVIASAVLHNEGTLKYVINDKECAAEQVYKHIAIAAPYVELIEEMTAKEFLAFHHQFKPLQLPVAEIIQIISLEKAADKQIRYFSSGMKQRLKLAQAFFSKTPVLLLDEPTTNLDADGIALYHRLITAYTEGKMVIISSNDPQEYSFCDEIIETASYKMLSK
ncbi:MAG: ABC transporter ATP-binding protein [Sphingobacteriales bacterium]|nr:ABC transporter ATP-binding protein [Sphingobacteriales bacterium]